VSKEYLYILPYLVSKSYRDILKEQVLVARGFSWSSKSGHGHYEMSLFSSSRVPEFEQKEVILGCVVSISDTFCILFYLNRYVVVVGLEGH
jgi:hypothetical protein